MPIKKVSSLFIIILMINIIIFFPFNTIKSFFTGDRFQYSLARIIDKTTNLYISSKEHASKRNSASGGTLKTNTPVNYTLEQLNNALLALTNSSNLKYKDRAIIYYKDCTVINTIKSSIQGENSYSSSNIEYAEKKDELPCKQYGILASFLETYWVEGEVAYKLGKASEFILLKNTDDKLVGYKPALYLSKIIENIKSKSIVIGSEDSLNINIVTTINHTKAKGFATFNINKATNMIDSILYDLALTDGLNVQGNLYIEYKSEDIKFPADK